MDNSIKEMLQSIVNASTEQKLSFAVQAIQNLGPELNKRYDNEQSTKIILAIFATSVAADGKLTKEEFALVKTFLHVGGVDMEDEKIVEMLAALASNGAGELVTMLNKSLSSEGQAHLFMLAAVICAIDDRIDSNEVTYLMDLYNA